MAKAAYGNRNILNVTVPKDPGVRIFLLINLHEIGKGKKRRQKVLPMPRRVETPLWGN